MSVFYVDASAWVKRYVQEDGSSRVDDLFEHGERIATSDLGYVETVAALARRLSSEQWPDVETSLQLDWHAMMRFDVSQSVVYRALQLAHKYKLRGADAVHLATALELQKVAGDASESVVLVAADRELLQAAEAAGLAVENPAVTV